MNTLSLQGRKKQDPYLA